MAKTCAPEKCCWCCLPVNMSSLIIMLILNFAFAAEMFFATFLSGWEDWVAWIVFGVTAVCSILLIVLIVKPSVAIARVTQIFLLLVGVAFLGYCLNLVVSISGCLNIDIDTGGVPAMQSPLNENLLELFADAGVDLSHEKCSSMHYAILSVLFAMNFFNFLLEAHFATMLNTWVSDYKLENNL